MKVKKSNIRKEDKGGGKALKRWKNLVSLNVT